MRLPNFIDEIVTIEGKGAGNTSLILGGVHGNEPCGVSAIKEIFSQIEPIRGTIIVGVGNPLAYRLNKRGVEANLNRMFDDRHVPVTLRSNYEYARAQFLKPYLQKADALLDLHGLLGKQATPFAICDLNSLALASIMPVETIVTGLEKFHPGSTDHYMMKLKRAAVCLECGYIRGRQSIEVAKQGIRAFLSAQGHIKSTRKTFSPNVKIIHATHHYVTQTDNFSLACPFTNFHPIRKEYVIGYDGEQEVLSPINGFIIFSENQNQSGRESVVFGKLCVRHQ